jgi:hypothetical protein
MFLLILNSGEESHSVLTARCKATTTKLTVVVVVEEDFAIDDSDLGRAMDWSSVAAPRQRKSEQQSPIVSRLGRLLGGRQTLLYCTRSQPDARQLQGKEALAGRHATGSSFRPPEPASLL